MKHIYLGRQHYNYFCKNNKRVDKKRGFGKTGQQIKLMVPLAVQNKIMSCNVDNRHLRSLSGFQTPA